MNLGITNKPFKKAINYHKKWDSKAIELGSSLVLKAYSSHKEMAGNGLAQGQVSLSMT